MITLIFVLILVLIDALLLLFLVYLIWPLFTKQIPYVAMNRENVQRLRSLAKIRRGDVICDLGSGDGRILIALSHDGAVAHGYEINIFFVWLSRLHIWRAGLLRKAHVFHKSFLDADLSVYDTLIIFGIPYALPPIVKKLKKEMKPTATVISYGYSLPDWEEKTEEKGFFIYTKPAIK